MRGPHNVSAQPIINRADKLTAESWPDNSSTSHIKPNTLSISSKNKVYTSESPLPVQKQHDSAPQVTHCCLAGTGIVTTGYALTAARPSHQGTLPWQCSTASGRSLRRPDRCLCCRRASSHRAPGAGGPTADSATLTEAQQSWHGLELLSLIR